MKGALLNIVFLAGCLLAGAEARSADNKPVCTTLERVQKAAGKDTTVAALTPAEFHFLQGMYVALPTTPDGLPPGDGAVILSRDKADSGLVLWTRGPIVCAPMPVSHIAKLKQLLAGVKSGAADGEEL
jgi:hypothetical protein